MCFNVYAVVCTYVAFCKDVLLFLQDSKKYFKRADLARKEEEEYYRRCGYKVQTSTVNRQLNHGLIVKVY